ncbi:hypothetical protein Tco_1424718 [Tanacetum coccineum]
MSLGKNTMGKGAFVVVEINTPKSNNVVGSSVINDITIPPDDDVVWWVDSGATIYFYVIKPNEFVTINSITESRDAIFDENKFSSIPRPSHNILVTNENGTDDIGDSQDYEEVPEEVVVQQHELKKRNRIPKSFGPNFQLYLIEETRDEVSNQHSYCFNVEDDRKTLVKAMNSQDVTFWKINK